jgi:hypothetical protein
MLWDFWPTIKPFLTNKGCNFQSDIILNENDNLLTSQSDICDVFNNFFINVAKDIGKDSVPVDDNHTSIIEINKIRTGIASYCIFKSYTKHISKTYKAHIAETITKDKANGIIK